MRKSTRYERLDDHLDATYPNGTRHRLREDDFAAIVRAIATQGSGATPESVRLAGGFLQWKVALAFQFLLLTSAIDSPRKGRYLLPPDFLARSAAAWYGADSPEDVSVRDVAALFAA